MSVVPAKIAVDFVRTLACPVQGDFWAALFPDPFPRGEPPPLRQRSLREKSNLGSLVSCPASEDYRIQDGIKTDEGGLKSPATRKCGSNFCVAALQIWSALLHSDSLPSVQTGTGHLSHWSNHSILEHWSKKYLSLKDRSLKTALAD